MRKQVTSNDWFNGNHVSNDIGFSATWRVMHEDVCTNKRALGNVRTGKYQQIFFWATSATWFFVSDLSDLWGTEEPSRLSLSILDRNIIAPASCCMLYPASILHCLVSSTIAAIKVFHLPLNAIKIWHSWWTSMIFRQFLEIFMSFLDLKRQYH